MITGEWGTSLRSAGLSLLFACLLVIARVAYV
jgi:hypothetical protein